MPLRQKIRALRVRLRLRLKRQRLLWRSFRSRHRLGVVTDRTALIRRDDILAFACVRNEVVRLPWFLMHHRALGVQHFLFVDNASDDGTRDYLAAQPDCSVWHTGASYKAARFGLDWVTWLLMHYGHGHWCLTLDADEAFIYPDHDTRPLRALTDWLDARGRPVFGALMLDMFPKGPLDAQTYAPGDDPFAILRWFDADNYTVLMKPLLRCLWVQGGARARTFFASEPRRAPTLNKIPLVRWNRRYAYVNSTHSLMPRELNQMHDAGGQPIAAGVLLHSKFLHTIIDKSREEKARREHFGEAEAFEAYYDGLISNPDLWHEGACEYAGWRQLVALGLMPAVDWA